VSRSPAFLEGFLKVLLAQQFECQPFYDQIAAEYMMHFILQSVLQNYFSVLQKKQKLIKDFQIFSNFE
jgi:hypothetical protein